MSEKVEITYRVIEESSGNYLLNYPTTPEDATYGKKFSKAAKLTGFQKIKLDGECYSPAVIRVKEGEELEGLKRIMDYLYMNDMGEFLKESPYPDINPRFDGVERNEQTTKQTEAFFEKLFGG